MLMSVKTGFLVGAVKSVATQLVALSVHATLALNSAVMGSHVLVSEYIAEFDAKGPQLWNPSPSPPNKPCGYGSLNGISLL